MATADLNKLKQDLTRRMDGALETLKREFNGLRTGRAHPGLLEPVKVHAYGTEMPLTQVGSVGVPEARMLTVQVWDRGLVGAVEKAIRDSGLGLNPASDGQLVRVPIPQLTTERRTELAKTAHKYAEGAKVAVRGVRRDGMEQIKTLREEARHRRGRGEGLDHRGAEADRRLHQARGRVAGGQGKGHPPGLIRTDVRRRAARRERPAPKRRPAHVAIIMDGNGRWAASRRLPRIAGHREGARAVRRTIEAAIRPRRGLADALRLLQRELAPAGGRGARPDRPAAPLPEERDRGAAGQRRAAAHHRRPRPLRSRHPGRPGAAER